jgi:Peroxin-3
VPEALKLLRAQLNELSGVQEITDQLQQIRNGELPADRKVELWHELRDRSFLRLAAAAWLEPVLATHVHVMVIVLGRHMYLESLARGADTCGLTGGREHCASAPHLWPLSVAQQAAFMRFATFLVQEGMLTVMPRMLGEVQRHVTQHKLQDELTLDAVRHSDRHSDGTCLRILCTSPSSMRLCTWGRAQAHM